MAELSSELSVLLAILTPTAAAFLTSYFTHRYAQKRENYAKRMKIVGWLEWLKDFLKQVNDLPTKQKTDKLPWWADHAVQSIGDSLHLLSENTRINLLKLIDECWIDAPVIKTSVEGKDGIASISSIAPVYDQSKIQNMMNEIEKLINQIKDP
jgi:hypothetical protein